MNCGIHILKDKKGLLVIKRPFFSFLKLVFNTAFLLRYLLLIYTALIYIALIYTALI